MIEDFLMGNSGIYFIVREEVIFEVVKHSF